MYFEKELSGRLCPLSAEKSYSHGRAVQRASLHKVLDITKTNQIDNVQAEFEVMLIFEELSARQPAQRAFSRSELAYALLCDDSDDASKGSTVSTVATENLANQCIPSIVSPRYLHSVSACGDSRAREQTGKGRGAAGHKAHSSGHTFRAAQPTCAGGDHYPRGTCAVANLYGSRIISAFCTRRCDLGS